MVMVITMVIVIIVVVVIAMIMIVHGVIMHRVGIGTAFGIERRLDLDHARTEPPHHRLDDMIASDPQAFGHDLGRQMPVTEMPAEPHQMLRILPANFQQRLGRCHHLDQPAVVEHQRVAAAQRDRILEIEQEFQPARADHRHPPPVPVVEIEHDGIGRRLGPAMLAMYLGRADHMNRPCGSATSSFETRPKGRSSSDNGEAVTQG
jgi:hypothetical protein